MLQNGKIWSKFILFLFLVMHNVVKLFAVLVIRLTQRKWK